MYARARHAKRTRRQVEGVVRIPSRKLEYAYYVAVIYSVMGTAVGLDIPVVGGLMLLVISATCIWQFRSSFKAVYGPIALLLACATSFFFIQIFVHGQNIMDSNIRGFITWVFGLIIVQSLCLRQGFCLRFPLVLFGIGASTLPFVGFNPAAAPGGVEMARVDMAVQGLLTHPAGLADWFAFCAVFFTVFGIEARRGSFRIGAWSLAVVCLFVVTLTVERGPLLGAVLAITVGFRRALKRSFAPVLALVIFVGVIAVTGLFEQALSKYAERGVEETGRETLWPMAVDRFLTSPLVGVGESNIFLPMSSKQVPPHNAFLHFALSSGVIPLAFFLAFWIQAARKSVFHTRGSEGDPFRLPYLVYTLSMLMIGDLGFMNYGALLTTSLAAGLVIPYGEMRPRATVPARARPLVRVRRSRSRPVPTIARSRF